jgi:hypothetical protein
MMAHYHNPDKKHTHDSIDRQEVKELAYPVLGDSVYRMDTMDIIRALVNIVSTYRKEFNVIADNKNRRPVCAL